MAASTTFIRGVQDAVRRIPGAYISPSIEARALTGMGIGVVAREPIPRATEVFRASRDVWYPFSSEYALHDAQQKAPGFLQQMDALFASSPFLRGGTSFVPNAIVLGTHLAITNAEPPVASVTDADSVGNVLQANYLASLPEFVELPFFWDEQQFQALEGCLEVSQSIRQSAQLYFQIYQHIFGSNNPMVSPDRFFWAISVLMSRATSGNGQPFTLIPFFDWFNHTNQGDECLHEYDQQRGEFVVQTSRDYDEGEQLCINYGAHANTRLLRNYGFTLSHNEHDILQLTLPAELQHLERDDPMTREKTAIIRGDDQANSISMTKKTINFTPDSQLSPSSLRWLHMRLANQSELGAMINQSATETTTVATASMVRIPVSLEQRTNELVRQLCQSKLKQHATALERDEKFLKTHDKEMASWLRSALHIRVSEKRLLNRAINRHS